MATTLVSATDLPARAASPTVNYYLYVCAESDDVVELIRFGPQGLEKLKTITVGSFPAETEGPHGINISPDGRHWYVSISHGMPFGSIHKYETGTDEWVADVLVGMFPATLTVSPSTELLYVVNFNLYGDMKPSSISVVETRTMTEVAQIPTGIMPHGARMNVKGTRVYSVNMMNDELVEVDAYRFEVARRLPLTDAMPMHMDHGDHGDDGVAMSDQVQPTWVSPPTPQGKVYVAGNANNRIYEVDLAAWKITRTFGETAPGPYNLDVTPDGKRLVVTYKKSAGVGFWDLEKGEEIARVTTTRKVPHGIIISPDGLYAFATLEGVGGEPGTVEVYDAATCERVAFLDVGKQAGGLVVWKAGP